MRLSLVRPMILGEPHELGVGGDRLFVPGPAALRNHSTTFAVPLEPRPLASHE